MRKKVFLVLLMLMIVFVVSVQADQWNYVELPPGVSLLVCWDASIPEFYPHATGGYYVECPLYSGTQFLPVVLGE